MLVKQAPMVLARLGYYVLAPALLFTLLGESPIERHFSLQLAVAAPSAVAAFGVYSIVAGFVWSRKSTEPIIGTLPPAI